MPCAALLLLVDTDRQSLWRVQIRQLFGFCGAVIGLNRVGDQQQYMFVEYTYPSVWPPASFLLLYTGQSSRPQLSS